VNYTKFGRTGLTVSRLCLCTATFGKQTEEEAAQCERASGMVAPLEIANQ
jgi:aryl-alcohol dehydrogenase-like predicted oxidoreductase